MSSRVNTLRVALEVLLTELVGARPDVLVVDLIGMFSRDLDTTISKEFGAFGAPDFELATVRLVLDAADHEVC